MTTPVRYTSDDLARELRVERTTIQRYLREGVLPRPVRRNNYTQAHLDQAKLVRGLLLEEYATFEGVRKELAARKRAAQAKAKEPPPAAPPPPPAPAAPPAPTPPPPASAHPYRRWDRIELVPGLELFVTADASPVVRRLADDVVRHFSLAAKDTG